MRASKNFTHVLIALISNKSIALTNKNYASLDSPAHKEYDNLCLVIIE